MTINDTHISTHNTYYSKASPCRHSTFHHIQTHRHQSMSFATDLKAPLVISTEHCCIAKRTNANVFRCEPMNVTKTSFVLIDHCKVPLSSVSRASSFALFVIKTHSGVGWGVFARIFTRMLLIFFSCRSFHIYFIILFFWEWKHVIIACLLV